MDVARTLSESRTAKANGLEVEKGLRKAVAEVNV